MARSSLQVMNEDDKRAGAPHISKAIQKNEHKPNHMSSPSATCLPSSTPFVGPYEKWKTLVYIMVFSVCCLVAGAFAFICWRRKEEQDRNPEYTRAILGDDAFEFSPLEIL
jgi:hypothetical protein